MKKFLITVKTGYLLQLKACNRCKDGTHTRASVLASADGRWLPKYAARWMTCVEMTTAKNVYFQTEPINIKILCIAAELQQVAISSTQARN